MRAALTILGALCTSAILASDWAWWTDTLPGIAMLVLLLAVVGGLCWLDGYQRGKS